MAMLQPGRAGHVRASGAAPRRKLLAAVALAVLTAGASVHAGAPSIDVGETTLGVERQYVDLDRAFRDTVEREIGGMDVRPASKGERYVVSAKLVTLETQQGRGGPHTTCVVSAVLRKKEGGALLAILRGHSHIENDRGVRATELQAIRAAVRGAFRRIPEAIKR